MKKITIIFAVLTFLFFETSMGQLFVGGNFYISTEASKSEIGSTSVDGDKEFDFGINPKAGFFLNDQFAVGAGIGLNISSTNDREDPERITSSSTFRINPFARYYFVQVDKFSVFAEGGINLGLGSSKVKTGGTTVDGPNVLDFTFYIMPAVSYDISDNFSLEAGIGGLFINSNTEKDNNDNKFKETNIDFSIDLNNIFFGAIYKF